MAKTKKKARRIIPLPKPGEIGIWKKTIPEWRRRASLRNITVRDGCGTVIKRLTALRNVTKDVPTKEALKSDADWLREQDFCLLKRKKKA